MIFFSDNDSIHLIVYSSIVIGSFIIIIRRHLQYISNEHKYSLNCQLGFLVSLYTILRDTQ